MPNAKFTLVTTPDAETGYILLFSVVINGVPSLNSHFCGTRKGRGTREAGGGRREAGDGGRGTGDGRRETGDGRRETGDSHLGFARFDWCRWFRRFRRFRLDREIFPGEIFPAEAPGRRGESYGLRGLRGWGERGGSYGLRGWRG